MPSTYTNNLGIQKPGTGEQSGSWGDTVNTNSDILDVGINGVLSLSLSGTSSTLTTSDGVVSNGQYKTLVLTGSPSGTHTITISPNDSQKIYFVRNTTAQSVVFTQGSGGNVTVATGTSKIIYSDGAGATAAVNDLTSVFAMSNPTITGGGITGSVINNTIIGGSIPAAGTFGSVTSPSLGSGGSLSLSAAGANPITASTNGSERLRIDSAGNVGIGISSPTASSRLHTYQSISSALVPSLTVGATYTTGNLSHGVGFSINNNPVSAGVYVTEANGPGANLVFTTAADFVTPTNTERMRIDASGNLGLGVTPSAWGGLYTQSFQMKAGGFLTNNQLNDVHFGVNAHHNGTSWLYTDTNTATRYEQFNGGHFWLTAPSGTAGTAITFTERLRIDTTGAIGIGGANYGTSGQTIVSAGSGAAPAWGNLSVAGGGTGASTLTGSV